MQVAEGVRGLGAETGRSLRRVLACGTRPWCVLLWVIAVAGGRGVHDGMVSSRESDWGLNVVGQSMDLWWNITDSTVTQQASRVRAIVT